MIFTKDETFIIDQKPQFVYGGELHYFRTPKDKWNEWNSGDILRGILLVYEGWILELILLKE